MRYFLGRQRRFERFRRFVEIKLVSRQPTGDRGEPLRGGGLSLLDRPLDKGGTTRRKTVSTCKLVIGRYLCELVRCRIDLPSIIAIVPYSNCETSGCRLKVLVTF